MVHILSLHILTFVSKQYLSPWHHCGPSTVPRPQLLYFCHMENHIVPCICMMYLPFFMFLCLKWNSAGLKSNTCTLGSQLQCNNSNNTNNNSNYTLPMTVNEAMQAVRQAVKLAKTPVDRRQKRLCRHTLSSRWELMRRCQLQMAHSFSLTLIDCK